MRCMTTETPDNTDDYLSAYDAASFSACARHPFITWAGQVVCVCSWASPGVGMCL